MVFSRRQRRSVAIACSLAASIPSTARAGTVVCGAATNGAVQGVDVSHYQGSFDWASAKANGTVFGVASVGDGTGFSDPAFASNWGNMQAAGIYRAAYQYFEPEDDPVAQANLMVQAVGQLGAGDLPCMLDVETTGGQSGGTIAANVQTWLNVVQQGTGRVPFIYTGPYFWDGSVGSTAFGSTPLWIADYGPSCPMVPNGWSSWTIWQYGDSGGTLDQDVFNGTLAQLQALAAEPACTPHCASSSTIVGSDCSMGDCAAFGSTCVDDSLGTRCVFSECPAQGSATICLNGTTLGTCANGQLSQGDCADFGSTCVADALGARCVFYECPADGTKSFCQGDAGTIATCNNGAYSTGDCAVFGASCVDDSLGTRCAFDKCPAQGTATICVSATTIGTCQDGAVSFGDCSVYGAACVADSLPARCVFSECPADGDATICVDGNTLGSCHNGAVSFQDCTATGGACVTSGGEGYCSGALAAIAVSVTSDATAATSGVADYDLCSGAPVTLKFKIENVGMLGWTDTNDLAPADTGKAVRLDTSDGTNHGVPDPLTGASSVSLTMSSNSMVDATGPTCTMSGCNRTLFTLTGKGPATTGITTTTWQLHDESRSWFGPVMALKLNVQSCPGDASAPPTDAAAPPPEAGPTDAMTGLTVDGSPHATRDAGARDGATPTEDAQGSSGGCSCELATKRERGGGAGGAGSLALLVFGTVLALRRGRRGTRLLPLVLAVVAASVAALAACSPGRKGSHSGPAGSASGSGPAYVESALSPSSSAARAWLHPAPSSSAVVIHYQFDAGTNECHLVYGPAQLPFLGEVALVPNDTGVLVVTHHDGVPTVTRVLANVEAGAPSTVDAGLATVTSPPCAVAGTFSYCMDPAGAIHRRVLEGEGRDVVVARGRPGTVFAAELLDTAHVVVAYLAQRKTTEGLVSEAYAVLDEGPPLRLSDDGSGSTHLALAHRGSSLTVLLIDGRVAMTPVHARTLSISHGALTLGEDAVIFVGGEAESSTRGALGIASNGTAYALVPIVGEAGFGMASVHLDDPPHVEEPVTWSPYLNGLDPAPIAATQGTTPIRVARVRPLEKTFDGPRGLELGRLDDKGMFVPYGLVGSKGRVKSAAIAMDHAGMMWLAFTDGAGTWLERRSCP